MAREIVIWCDPCMADDVRTPAVEHSIGITIGVTKAVQTMTVACCPDHTDALLKPLAALIEEHGSPIDPTQVAVPSESASILKSASGRQVPGALTSPGMRRKGRAPAGNRGNQCLWCDLTYAGKSASGFARHLRVAHGIDGLSEAFSGRCPVCGDGPYSTMGSHIAKSHADMGFEASTDPFLWARDHGDPHGVYAEKLALEGSLDPEAAWEDTRKRERRTVGD